MSKRITNPLIVALDVGTAEEALEICTSLKDKVEIFKVGLQLFLAGGRRVVDEINAIGCGVFLDLKICDIPYQSAGAAEQIVGMNVKMFTVHTMGGFEMMKAVAQRTAEVSKEAGRDKPIVLGVTVLTSWDQEQIDKLGIGRRIPDQVIHLAKLAQEAGLDGVVASPREITLLREKVGKDFVIVTPGIRPSRAPANDQKRVLAPREAIEAGADYIVVGRPILSAKKSAEAASKILSEIQKTS